MERGCQKLFIAVVRSKTPRPRRKTGYGKRFARFLRAEQRRFRSARIATRTGGLRNRTHMLLGCNPGQRECVGWRGPVLRWLELQHRLPQLLACMPVRKGT